MKRAARARFQQELLYTVIRPASVFLSHHRLFSSLQDHRPTPLPPAQDNCELIEDRSALTAIHPAALSPTSPPTAFDLLDDDDQPLPRRHDHTSNIPITFISWPSFIVTDTFSLTYFILRRSDRAHVHSFRSLLLPEQAPRRDYYHVYKPSLARRGKASHCFPVGSSVSPFSFACAFSCFDPFSRHSRSLNLSHNTPRKTTKSRCTPKLQYKKKQLDKRLRIHRILSKIHIIYHFSPLISPVMPPATYPIMSMIRSRQL